MFNVVILSGRLTADPELKTTPSGVCVCSFTIAVERRYKQGEDRQADFINIVAWRHTAEFICKYFKKGSMIGIEGSIQTRKYQDKEGNNRTAFEVVVSDAQFFETKRDDAPTTNHAPTTFSNAGANDFAEVALDDDLPF